MNWSEIQERYEYRDQLYAECDLSPIYDEEPKTLKEIIVLIQEYDKEQKITHNSNPTLEYEDYCQAYCSWEQVLCEKDFQRYIDDLFDEYGVTDE